LESSFEEIDDYKHCIIVQHLAYFQRQDGDLFDGIFDQCVFDAQIAEPLQEIVFDDPKDNELGLPPEDSLPVPISQIVDKYGTDGDFLRACMSGGEIPINTDTFKDRPTIDMSKLAGTSDSAGTGTSNKGIDL
jgi:hypothetical protein